MKQAQIVILILSMLCLQVTEARVAINIDLAPAKAIHRMVQPPHGFQSCHMIPKGYYEDVWMNSHQVCEYSAEDKRGVLWVAGHYICKEASQNGVCRNWTWRPEHWATRKAGAYQNYQRQPHPIFLREHRREQVSPHGHDRHR
jgi:hypothetical protein